jgi:hypothetical protein
MIDPCDSVMTMLTGFCADPGAARSSCPMVSLVFSVRASSRPSAILRRAAPPGPVTMTSFR